MKKGWQDRLKKSVSPNSLHWDPVSLQKYSVDYHHFSPVLARELKGKVAECIASPRNAEELDAILSIAAEYGVPLTLRGSGTGNYGQCVPLSGGIVLHFANMDKIIEVGDGFMRVQPGARMGKMEAVARSAGQELRTMPSTFQTATIGGFLSGGFGGIGSITWGTIWDGLVQSLTVKTVEVKPRTFEVSGNETRPYLHTYGTLGVLSEIQIATAPRVEWMQWIVSFADWETAATFAREIAEDERLEKRLVSCHEWPIPSFFVPFKLPAGRSVVLAEIGESCEAAFLKHVGKRFGQVERKITSEYYHRGLGVSDFSWNHTTLWALKSDPDITYLQVNFDPHHFIEKTKRIKAEFPEFMAHVEFAKINGSLTVSGLPLLRFESEERLNRLIAHCREIGLFVANPHTSNLEDGGRSYPHDKLWAIKRRNDPYEVLNPQKLKVPFLKNA